MKTAIEISREQYPEGMSYTEARHWINGFKSGIKIAQEIVLKYGYELNLPDIDKAFEESKIEQIKSKKRGR